MKREWKRGDVALIRSDLGFVAVGLRSGVPSNMGWAYTSDEIRGGPRHYGNCWTSDPDAEAVVRPLVVIDPEDREQVERLVDAYRYVSGEVVVTDGPWSIPGLRMQAALREFANPTPPTPDEPLGLGAVVEDAAGQRWVRAGLTHRKADDWRCVDGERVGYWSEWDSVTAVRVLSEGVTEDGAS